MANKKLEKMLKEMKHQNTNRISDEMMSELRKGQFILPAVLPQDISPQAMKQFIQNQGTNKPMPEGVNPNPCIIQNSEGEQYLPLFTSIEEMNKGKNQFPLSINVSFDAAADMVQGKKNELMGLVINPFTHNLVMRLKKEKLQEQPGQSGQITLEQYHALARRQMEAAYLPGKLFEQKETLVQKLCEEKGGCLREMYEELYQEEIACPYASDEFEFMSLNISETLLVTQITMPEKNRYPHLCHSVIFAFDREKNKIWYYAIVYEGKGIPSTLVQVTEKGEPKKLGEAPAEGSEITKIIELIEEGK